MNTAPPDPYQILGISPTATSTQINRAYRSLLRAHHRDTREQDRGTPAADAALQTILTAYHTLGDLGRRELPLAGEVTRHRASTP